MTVSLPANAVGPFSCPYEMIWPTLAGFLVTPAATPYSPNWGFPIYPDDDPTKGRIFPGTYGSSIGPCTLLTKRKNTWVENKKISIQKAGPVNWWGTTKGTVGMRNAKYVLSYYGPKSRLFPDGFVYGTSSSHREVYMDGGVVALAPGPVTGAALVHITAEADLVRFSPSLYYIVVICIMEGKEYICYRPLPEERYPGDISDAAIKQLISVVRDDPRGWVMAGCVSVDGYDTPTSPFFFSEDGTKASSIRLKNYTFDSGEGGAVTEKIGSLIEVTFSPTTGVTVTDSKNDPPYEYTEYGKKEDYGDWTSSELDVYGGSHTWEEHQLAVTETMSGRQIVAVDYVGNEQIIVRLTIDVERGFLKDWMLGKDSFLDIQVPGYPAGTYYPTNYNHLNNNLHLGEVKPAGPRDHTANIWIKDKLLVSLDYTIAGTNYSHLVEATENINSDPVTKILVKSTHERVYARYFDVRGQVLVGSINREQLTWNTNPAGTPVVVYGPRDHTGRYTVTITYVGGGDDRITTHRREIAEIATSITDSVSSVFATNGDADTSIFTKVWPEPLGFYTQTGWDTMKAWDANFEWGWSYHTYTGSRPTLNNDSSKGNLSSKYHYQSVQTMSLEGWLGIGILRHNKFTQECGVGFTPTKVLLGNFYIPDPEKPSTLKLFTVASTELSAATSLAGGDKLYPIGVI